MLGLMTFDEARATLGLRGKAPLVTEELIEHFITQKLSPESQREDEIEDTRLEPKIRDGRDPDNKPDA